MTHEKLGRILTQIARENQTTPEEVYKEMMFALQEGQRSTDPAVQARWRAIPRKGKELTLEEFLDYAAAKVRNTCS